MKSRLRLEDFARVFLHAGKKYREELIPRLENIGVKCETPLKHLGIGKQKAWYKAQKLLNGKKPNRAVNYITAIT